jgi:hypothetical protein
MFTLEIEKYADFNHDNVFRITIANDDMEVLSHEDFRAYTNLKTIVLENNTNLKKIDLRGNTSIRYICLGSCDKLTQINLDQTNINKIDLYDLIALESVELDNKQLLNLKNLLSDNITKQFLYIEDAITDSFERRINATQDPATKTELLQAYEAYLESMDE